MRIEAEEFAGGLEALLDRLEEGEEILITRHGRLAARLVAATPPAEETGEDGFGKLRTPPAPRPGAYDWNDGPKPRNNASYGD